MNIIHLVLGKANPERMNGINKVVHNLATEFKNLGHQVSVWGITPSPNEKTSERIYDLRLFKSSNNKFSISKELIQAVEEVNKDTIFHLHGGFVPEFYQFSKLLIKHKLAYVVTPHGNYAANAMKKNKTIKFLYFHQFEVKMLKSCKALHCIGQKEWEDLDKISNIPQKVLIPNGQNLDDIPHIEIAKKSTEIPIFGFCGRITKEQKGLDLLLEGFHIYLNEHKSNGELWLIGEGEYLEEMKKRALALKIDKQIQFFGTKYGNEKFELIARMDAFYHPSRNEGLPTAVLEAAALEVPCVVSEYTNMGSYIENNDAGIFMKKNTAIEIAETMNQISKMKKAEILAQKGRNARNMISNQFNWNKIAQELVKVYSN